MQLENETIEQELTEGQEVSDNQEEQVEEQLPVASPSNQDNIRALRERKEQVEKERDTYFRQVQELQSQQWKAMQKPEPEPIDDDPLFSMPDDEILEARHAKALKKEFKSYKKQIDEERKKFAKEREQIKQSTADARIKSTYPDFEKVVNKDTFARLEKEHPDLARTLNETTDIYSGASSAYKMIKSLGLDGSSQSASEKTIKGNFNKPRPASAISAHGNSSPLQKANMFAGGLTDELKKQLRAEMESAINR